MSEDQILQICNDIAEDMLSPRVTKKQLAKCVNYWADKYSDVSSEFSLFKVKSLRERVEQLLAEPDSEEQP